MGQSHEGEPTPLQQAHPLVVRDRVQFLEHETSKELSKESWKVLRARSARTEDAVVVEEGLPPAVGKDVGYAAVRRNGDRVRLGVSEFDGMYVGDVVQRQ